MVRSIGVLMAGVALIGAGCGSSSSSSSTSSATPTSTAAPASSSASTSSSPTPAAGGGGKTVHLSALAGALAFNSKQLNAKAGTVTLSMSNPSSSPHGIAIEGNGVDKDGKVVQAGGTSTVTVTLKPGTYTYYCPVPGHRQAGMEGKLTVT